MKRFLIGAGSFLAVLGLGCLSCVFLPILLGGGEKQRRDAASETAANATIVKLEQWRNAHGSYPTRAVAASNGVITMSDRGEYDPAPDLESFEYRYLEAPIPPFTSDCFQVYTSKTRSWDTQC